LRQRNICGKVLSDLACGKLEKPGTILLHKLQTVRHA
jgi:hypothetical protein